MKPIFVIQMPLGTPAEVLEKAYEQTHNKGIDEDYHVLLTIGKDTTVTFKCFNSPYTEEEYSKLEQLIKEINKDYVIEKN
jgi:N-acetyl-anhydromuramyl-L-alanine amidase AmpD